MKCLDKIYFRSKFIGLENVPSDGNFIVASNHISNLDPFIIGIVQRRKFSFMAKDSLFKNRILAGLFYAMNAFPINRDGSDFRALRETLRRLKSGTPIVLFPEGTRGTKLREKKVQSGVGLIAVKSQQPVLPVYIKGSDKALPNGAKWFRRHPVTVKIGKPMHFPQKTPYSQIANQIMGQINSLSH